MVRRTLSIVLYIIGGMFLMSTGMIAFAELEPGAGKAVMLAVMAPFFLIPLGIGALVSRGHRHRELGIVLLVAAAVSAATIGILAYFAIMPDTRQLVPPETQSVVGDPIPGIALLASMAAIGWALFGAKLKF